MVVLPEASSTAASLDFCGCNLCRRRAGPPAFDHGCSAMPGGLRFRPTDYPGNTLPPHLDTHCDFSRRPLQHSSRVSSYTKSEIIDGTQEQRVPPPQGSCGIFSATGRSPAFLRALLSARSVDKALALTGVLSLAVVLRAFAGTQAFAAIGAEALDASGLRAASSSCGAVILRHCHIGHEHQANSGCQDCTLDSRFHLRDLLSMDER